MMMAIRAAVRLRQRTWIAAALLLVPGLAAAQVPASAAGGPRAQGAPLVNTGPTVDGLLTDSIWTAAALLDGFVQHEPLEGTPSTERTEVRILHTLDALYVGAWLYDREPDRIVPGERRRDADITQGDAFFLLLDTFRDEQNGFVFGTSPAAVEYDGQIRGDAAVSVTWDGSWTVATTQNEEGWFAEMRIPFSTLRYGPSEVQEWGLNLVRYIGRKNEQVVWSPVARQYNIYRLTEAGVLEDLRPPSRRVATVTPYVLSGAQRVAPVEPGVSYPFELGVDAKLGITQSLALDLTVNTDFAQVEVDDQQVDLSRVSLFFPEKRPFFLENAGLFSVGLPTLPGRTSARTLLFHSRQVGVAGGRAVPIDWGSRMSGRVAGTDVGMLHMRTAGLDGIQEAAGWSVARVSRELPNRSQLGAMVASRDFSAGESSWNRTYGIDGRLGIGDIWTFTGLVGRTDEPGVTDGRDLYSLVGEFLTPRWYIRSYHDRIGRNFNPGVGFVPYAGFEESSLRVERIWRPQATVREVRSHLRRTWRHDDVTGFRELDFRHWHLNVNFEDGAVFSPALNWQEEGLDEPFAIRGTNIVVPVGTYRGWNGQGMFSTNPSAPLSLRGNFNVGSFLSGDRLGGTAAVTFRRGATLSGSVSLTHNRLSFDEGDFNTTLSRVDLQYAFTPGVFVQSLVQYSDQTGLWSGNVRFGWLNTAGTGLYIVYNEQQTLDIGGIPGLWPRNPVELPERTLVIKYTRQFDFADELHGAFD